MASTGLVAAGGLSPQTLHKGAIQQFKSLARVRTTIASPAKVTSTRALPSAQSSISSPPIPAKGPSLNRTRDPTTNGGLCALSLTGGWAKIISLIVSYLSVIRQRLSTPICRRRRRRVDPDRTPFAICRAGSSSIAITRRFSMRPLPWLRCMRGPFAALIDQPFCV